MPSGRTYCAEMRPHVLALPVAPSVVVWQISIAFAASVPAVLLSDSEPSQTMTSLSILPSQSSSMPLPGTSKAPGLIMGLQSLQSPVAYDQPLPSWSVESMYGQGPPSGAPLPGDCPESTLNMPGDPPPPPVPASPPVGVVTGPPPASFGVSKPEFGAPPLQAEKTKPPTTLKARTLRFISTPSGGGEQDDWRVMSGPDRWSRQAFDGL